MTQDLLARREALGPAYRLFYDQPLCPVRAQDVWLEEADGRRFLDAYNNVPVVGHCHPRVVEALAEQAALLNTHTRYLQAGVVTYAERLLAHFPAALSRVMFTCTGSEANDLALRIAAAATGRSGIIVTHNAYHGVTSSLAAVSPSLRPVGAHVRVVSPPHALGLAAADVAQAFAAQTRSAIHSLRSAGLEPAALLIDSVFASDGICTASDGSLAAAAREVRAAGGLFIADEVQGGFGRIGGEWWAFERDRFVPDMVTLGKPMGNGHPIGAVVLRAELASIFGSRERYFNTFGGNSVSAAVGLAVLDVLETTGAAEHAATVGATLSKCLAGLQDRHPCIAAVRGRGLYWGVELCDEQRVGGAAQQPAAAELTRRVVNGMRNDGVLVGTCGAGNNVLKIRPPLSFTTAHVSQLLQALERQLSLHATQPRTTR